MNIRRALAMVLVAATAAGAAACTGPTAPPPTSTTLPPGVTYLEGNYGAGTDATSFLLWKNDSTPAERLVVFVHGGAWTAGSRHLVPAPVKALLNEGYAVASIEYPLSGVDRHPEQARYVKDALVHFEAQSGALGIEGDEPVLVGFSAGGHLAGLAGFTAGVAGYAPHAGTENVPGAVVLLGAPFDLVQMNNAGLAAPIAIANAVALNDYTGCVVVAANPGCDPALVEGSPRTYLNSGDPAVYAVYSTGDERISYAQLASVQQQANLAGVAFGAQATVSTPFAVNECVEYLGAPGCDANFPSKHAAVPKALDTDQLANWLVARGLGA